MSDTPLRTHIAEYRQFNDAKERGLDPVKPSARPSKPPPPPGTLSGQIASSFAKAREALRETTSRVDDLLSTSDILRAIERVRPQLSGIPDPELRLNLELILEAASVQLRGRNK